jgi:hypothetical protein
VEINNLRNFSAGARPSRSLPVGVPPTGPRLRLQKNHTFVSIDALMPSAGRRRLWASTPAYLPCKRELDLALFDHLRLARQYFLYATIYDYLRLSKII